MSLYLRDYRLIFEATGDGVLVLTQRGIRDANPAFCGLLGFSHAQLLRTSVTDLLTADSTVILQRRLNGPYESRPDDTFRLTLVGNRGRLVHVATRLVQGDDCWFLFGRAAEDDEVTLGAIPPSRAPQEADRHRQLIEHLADGLVTLNEIGELLFVNQTFARMLGLTQRSRLVGRPLLQLVVAEDRDRVLRGLRRWRDGETLRFEARLRHANGTETPVLLSGSTTPPRAAGLPRGIQVLVTDFAERRALVERLALVRQMEGLSSLAGGIAHDFNNLLTGILGNASAIRSLSNPDGEIGDLALGVEESAELAARLTQRLLALVRGQAPNRELLDVAALAQETLHLLERVIPDDIEVRVEVEDELPAVLADRSQLQQAVLNLAVNARDAMITHAGGGVLTLRVRPDVLSKPLDDGDVAEETAVNLMVMDTGPGVPASLRRRIFDPFFSTKGLGRGTGLGLSSVFNLAEAHGGSIEVDEAPGGGARFCLRLPAHTGSTVGHRTSPHKRAPLPLLRGSGRVLLAEDEDGIRTMVVGALRRQGYDVLEARDGREALAQWARHRATIDLLMLDVRMPHVEGTDVLRRCRLDRPEVPAILSSGFIPEGEDDSDLPQNITYLPKPYRMGEMLLVVGRTMAGPTSSGDFAKITPTDGIRTLAYPETDSVGTVAPAGKGFDPARTLTEGEMPALLSDLAHLIDG